MHCPEEYMADAFCKYLTSVGEKWLSGNGYDKFTNWNKYKSGTVYYFNDGQFGDISYDDPIFNCNILEYDDFCWEDESEEREENNESMDEFLSELRRD